MLKRTNQTIVFLIFTSLLVMSCARGITSQKKQKDYDNIGLTVANKLMRCCSSMSGDNVYAKVDYTNVRKNKTTGARVVPMTVGWTGTATGKHYWIQGELIINPDGSKEWLKIRDSGGFTPHCSEGCIR